jgi:hypothetical protein
MELYGEKGANGVILITLVDKKAVSEKSTRSESNLTVRGEVKDSAGKPVVGATIIIVGKSTGTISDTKGRFSLAANESDELSVSHIGMKKTLVKAQSTLIIILEKE